MKGETGPRWGPDGGGGGADGAPMKGPYMMAGEGEGEGERSKRRIEEQVKIASWIITISGNAGCMGIKNQDVYIAKPDCAVRVVI